MSPNTRSRLINVGAALLCCLWFCTLALAAPPIEPQGPLFPKRAFDAGVAPTSVDLGDFNGDGRLDAVVGNAGHREPWMVGGSGVSVLIGHPDGSFGAPSLFEMSDGVWSVLVADFDRNGLDDVAVATRTFSGNDLRVLLNDGQGGFAEQLVAPIGSQFITSGDFDGNGSPDIAAPSVNKTDVSIFLGDGMGLFEPAREFAAGTEPASLAVLDANNDGHQDLGVANRGESCPAGCPPTPEPGSVVVLIGDGAGDFTAPLNVTEPGDQFEVYISIGTGDFNSDGNDDLVYQDLNLGQTSVVYGGGDGTFGSPVPLDPYGLYPFLVDDLDEDGFDDLVLNSGNRGDLFVLRGTIGGLTLSSSLVDPAFSGSGLAAGDLNDDGARDLVHSDFAGWFPGYIFPYLGRGDGSFATDVRSPIQDRATDYVRSDFDLDGIIDMAVLRAEGFGAPDDVLVMLGNGDGTFRELVEISVGTDTGSIATADFDHDGLSDLVVTNAGSGDLSILLGAAGGSFAPEYRVPSPAFPLQVEIADFNRDGNADLAVIQKCSDLLCNWQRVAVHLGWGAGTFQAPRDRELPSQVSDLVIDDFDRDGLPDLVVSSYAWGGIRFFPGDGDGTFGSSTLIYSSSPVYSLTQGDLNGDGFLDLIAGGADEFLLGNGDGTFALELSGLNLDFLVAVADLNVDGAPDIFTGGISSLSKVYLGDGQGAFPAFERYKLSFFDVDPIGDDFNGDLRIDVATTLDEEIIVLPNLNGFPDTDGDGLPNNEDPCTDTDEDGLGNPGFANPGCATDNCPDHPNPLQIDNDDDGHGDACDTCPFDPLDDPDGDGICNTDDNCSARWNAAQEDGDGDGYGDYCDNCRDLANVDQADSNDDGSGDACQPRLSIIGTARPDAATIVVSVVLEDPQNDPFNGSARVIGPDPGFTILNWARNRRCEVAYQVSPWAGVLYVNRRLAGVYDQDSLSVAGCGDGQQDLWIFKGTCQNPMFVPGSLGSSLDLRTLTLPAPICIGWFPTFTPAEELTVLGFDSNSLTVSRTDEVTEIAEPFTGAFPQVIALSGLAPGTTYRMMISGTDGSTRAVDAAIEFVYAGETQLVLERGENQPPQAVISVPQVVECDRPGAGGVTLDGSGSNDPDASPPGNGIVRYEWFDVIGGNPLPLGEGVFLDRALSLGEHTIRLKVTDTVGENGTAEMIVNVRDTIPPIPSCQGLAPIECSSTAGAEITLIATATDLCTPNVLLTNDRTAGGADASGTYPLGTTMVGFTATDESGNMASCSSTVVVKDETAPSLSLAADPAELWPPNHRMVPVGVSWVLEDICDAAPQALLLGVTSSEPDDAPDDGDGATSGDLGAWAPGTPQTAFSLRAERSGNGPGRIYQMTYEATDASGNTTPAVAIVTVPHDQGAGPEPLLMQLQPDGAPERAHIYWPGLPGILGYDLMVGDLSRVVVQDGYLTLDAVQVLARGTPATEVREGPATVAPPAGGVFIYLLQQRDARGGAGYGTATAPWPRLPLTCEDGCP